MKKMNNKGFSLVELIVVIAIMAVLIGVLAPQFLRYVEKSRLQKDNQAISEVANAAKAAMANEAVFTSLPSGTTITPGSNKFYSFASTAGSVTFGGELANTVGSTVNLASKKYTSAPNIEVVVDTTTATVKVSCPAYFEDVNASAVTKVF